MLYEEIPLACSLVTSIDTETSLSASNVDRKGNGRRFNRSGSRQRSKSKQAIHELQDAQGFYIKNVFAPSSSSQETIRQSVESDAICQKSGNCDKGSSRNIQRRNNHMRQSEANTSIFADGSKEYFQKKCGELDQLLNQSHSYIIQLQSRIDQLQEQMRRKTEGNESQSLRDRHDLSKTAKENKPNNLAHLRKQIASTKAVQLVSPEALQHQVKLLQSQDLFLKEEVNTLKRTIKQHQQTFLRIRSQRHTQLQTIIQQQRKTLLSNQKLQEQLKIEVSMLRLRQSKKDENKQQKKNEEFAYLKFRCEKMRKKYDETKKALERYEKQERVNYLLSEGKAETQINFCLSP